MISQGIRASFLASTMALTAMAFTSDCSAQTRSKADSNGVSTIKTFLAKFEGWWGFLPDGCKNVEDNQYRVAIGRYIRTTNDKIIFGRGEPAIGFYDPGCSIVGYPELIGDLYVFKTKCESEGEKYHGNATLRLSDDGQLFLRTPMNVEEINLYRCVRR